MPEHTTHPVDWLTDAQLKALMLRVDTAGFPGDLDQLFDVEHGLEARATLLRQADSVTGL